MGIDVCFYYSFKHVSFFSIPHQSLNKTFLYQKWNGGTSNFWFDLDAEVNSLCFSSYIQINPTYGR